MIELIQKVCAGLGGGLSYKIVEQSVESVELFFIRNELDMNRAKKVRHYGVTVYRDFEEAGAVYKGAVSVKIHPTMNGPQIRQIVSDAFLAAGYVKTPVYPLTRPGQQLGPTSSGKRIAEEPIQEWAAPVCKAVFGAAEGVGKNDTGTGWINSAEIFLSRVDSRLVNSAGIDVSQTYSRGEMELITTWQGAREQVELYRLLRFNEPDTRRLSQEVTEMLEMCRDRGRAQPTPALKRATVLLSGAPVRKFLSYYYAMAAARNVYEKISTLRIGDNVQGQSVHGDLVNLKLDPWLANSTESRRYDEDGIALAPVPIFHDGNLVRYWGDQQYSYYLQAEPTGVIANQIFQGGRQTIAQLQDGPHLELLDFSDFQMDVLTGIFGGEIRLGWYYDGSTRYPISGGSITGNIREVQQDMYFSRELFQDNHFVGPRSIKLFDITVTGSCS